MEKRVVTADNKAALAAFLASGARLYLPASEQPEVCIVLVLYNQAHFTLACLRSIAADVGVPMEVVIVDNASSDETPALLKRIEGARVIWNEENLGFLKGANQGAGEANAPYILFLNNDALLLPGTLSAALETLERESNVGAVGAKIILPGGALQEAGSIIWRDGSCVGYGRGGNPVAPEFMFRRNVDYVSGAFLLTPHQIWKELGGFDLAFAPAYYEETDYCMRMRKAGYRIVYEPRAQIFHYEFGSSKDSTAAIELQRNNQSLLYERHKDVLTRAHYASYPRCTLFARSRSAKAGRVLFIDDRVPDPRAGGGFPRANAIVLTLQELGYFVTHYPLRVPEEHWETVYKCMPREVEVMLGHGIDGLRPFLEERKGYYDAVIVSRPHNMAQLKRLLNSAPDLLGGAKLIYDAEAVFALRKNLQWEVLGKTMSESRKNENVLREVTMAAEADVVLAVSEGEAAHFRQNLIRDVKILGNMIEPDPTPAEFEERDLFLFVGRMNEDNSPNVDSVIWFYEEILPRLRERIGKLPEIALIGLNSAPQLTKIDRKQLNFIGPIDDLEAYYNRARLFFAPTRFSGGLPHKVHEAAARGVPAVVTPILVHQLGWVHEKEVLVGETAEAFADQCVRLATDRTLWTRLRTSALERVTEECSRETFRTTLQDIMPDCPSSNDLRRMAV